MRLRIICLALAMLMLLFATGFAGGGEPCRVALIDTGVSSEAIAEKNLIEGRNYVSEELGTEDKEGHGTAIASIIVGSKSAKVRGVCENAEIVPLVFYTVAKNGEIIRCNVDMMAQMVLHSINIYNCNVINMSSGTKSHSALLHSAVSFAAKKGALIVTAIGNDGDATAYYPAMYEGVLAVGSVNSAGDYPAVFSNRNGALDILAPGENLTVASLSGDPISETGTSFSCAYVSGIAARLMTEFPSLRGFDVAKILMSSARDICDAGYDELSGWGVLDEKAAREYAADGRIFRDVTKDKWYFEAANSAARLGIMSGTTEVTFAPETKTSRAMLWMMLARMSGAETESAGAWYEGAQVWSKNSGISDGENPEGAISREQLATMLFRYAAQKGMDTSHRAKLEGFGDSERISDYAKDAMSWAVSTGLIGGTGKGELSPQSTASRAEVAAMLVRFEALMNK